MSDYRLKFAGAALAAFLFAVAPAASAKEIGPLATEDAGVALRVKPLDLGAASKAWTFELVLDTHSQDLADDFTRTAVLIGDAGKPQPPLAWDGAGPGGHHRKGVLRFAPINPRPSAIELRVQRQGEARPRSFRWQLQ